MINRSPFSLVGRLSVNLEKVFYFIEHRFFRRIVTRSELLSSLEHKVFEIMRESGGLRRIVLASDLDRNVGLDSRSFLVDAHVDLKAIVKRVNPCVHRIVLDRLILFRTRGRDERGNHCSRN